MNKELPSNSNQPHRQSGKFKFLLIALGPIPIGLLVFTSKAFVNSNLGQSGLVSALVMMGIFTLICSIFGSIGVCGGFDEASRAKSLIGGILLGIFIFILDILVTFFAGCALIANSANH